VCALVRHLHLLSKQWSCELGLGLGFSLRAARVHTHHIYRPYTLICVILYGFFPVINGLYRNSQARWLKEPLTTGVTVPHTWPVYRASQTPSHKHRRCVSTLGCKQTGLPTCECDQRQIQPSNNEEMIQSLPAESVPILVHTLCPKNVHLFIFQIILSQINRF